MKEELAETVADIVAELREDAEHVEDDIHNEDFWSNTEAGMIYRELAARIEAANDRQMAGKCGNAAAMREALKRIIAIEGYGAPWIEAKVIAQKALEGAQCTPPPAQDTAKIEHPCDAAAMREALERVLAAYKSGAIHTCAECYRDEWDDELGDLKASVEAALAAPPRNCDRFQTVRDAGIEFAKQRNNPHPCPDFTFSAWLFATEGGAE